MNEGRFKVELPREIGGANKNLGGHGSWQHGMVNAGNGLIFGQDLF
jgi:hypothetical protein